MIWEYPYFRKPPFGALCAQTRLLWAAATLAAWCNTCHDCGECASHSVQCTVQQQSAINNQQSAINNQQPTTTTNNQQQKQQQQQQEQEQEQNQQTNNETNHKTNNKTHKNNTTNKTREASKSQTSTIIVNTVEAVSPETYRCTSPPWRLIRLPNWEFGTINREPLASNYCCRAQTIHKSVHFWKEKQQEKMHSTRRYSPMFLAF